MSPNGNQPQVELENCAELFDSLYESCLETAPNFGVGFDYFQTALERAARKYLFAGDAQPNGEEIEQFFNELQINDLFLALGCAAGNERAWWEFDQQHRAYLERVARHLARTDTNADEVIDSVYVELYGTRIVDGVRQSKFATYTGRGSLRGWLRTIVWHALVDLHRASHDEVSLDEMTETVGEGHAQASFLNQTSSGGELEMHDRIARERYRKATTMALETAFGALDDHEKLLLLYYHVENLKLREISRMVETPESPLRRWFQRKSERRAEKPDAKVHESTVMRWLEKVYARVLQRFRHELKQNHRLKESEIEACLELAVQDISGAGVQHQISSTGV